MAPVKLEPLEREVMEKLLAGDDPKLAILRGQFALTEVAERELTGVGFYVRFVIPSVAPCLKDRRLSHLGDVKAEIGGLKHGAGFVLHLHEGVMDYLEGYSYDEPWPPVIEVFSVSYIDGEPRDRAALWKKWAG